MDGYKPVVLNLEVMTLSSEIDLRGARMDEAEKYKQRLEAIAEKRRQQDEQDRARREMEDEKIRLQQLKRKSLRDQWLMEGAPLSPVSPDPHSPRSPLWGSQTQEMEKDTDKYSKILLQSESQCLAEEKENEQMEDGQTQEAMKVAEDGTAIHEDELKTNKILQLEESEVVLTNGGGALEANHKASEQDIHSNTNGPMPDVNTNKEEEEGSLVIRAERVIITDDGDDVPEDLTPQHDQPQTMSGETLLPNQEATRGGGEAEKVVITTEAAPEAITQPDETEATAEAQAATGDEDLEGDIKSNKDGDGETKAEGQDKLEDPASVQLQSPATALEGTAVASVPVYFEAQPPALVPKAVGEATMSPEGAEEVLKAQDPATIPGQFQEVPLADLQENQRTDAGPGEQEPLLSQAKAPSTEAEPAAANNPAKTETHNPTRDNGGASPPPDSAKCKCCSVIKRREVDQKELDEFVSQVECLNMPKHRVMDPTREPCPIPVQSAPLACESQPLEQLDRHYFEGRWVLVAGSLNSSADAEELKGRDSVTIDYNNSTYTQTIRLGDQCEYYPLSVTVEGHILKLSSRSFNFTVTFFPTSCPDCAVMRLDVVSSRDKSVDIYLLSKRREVEQKEMEEFRAQWSSGQSGCEELIRPLEKINFDDLEGRWTLLAGSLKDPATVDLLKGRDSVTIDFINSTYTQVNRVGDKCEYYSHNASLEGHILTLRVASFNFTATFFNTSCPDCAVLTWDVESPHYKSVEFYLLSRRREVEQKEMEEFRAQ
ncbi:hypothetical protein INR49_029437, partial [Caranx melampygus]